MNNIDKRALREAAEKATPGRIGDRIDGSGSIKYQCFGNDGSLVLQTDHKNMEYGFIGGNSEADELFFRLCDPATVLALLDELEASQAKNSRVAGGIEAAIKLQERAEVAEKLIAELEAREVKLPELKMLSDYLAEVTMREREDILVGVRLEFHRALKEGGIKIAASSPKGE
ncbi:ead/Ea22-like family protein [Enterobacter sp. RHBSTW-00175]|uniref:ead/Ea22-like family protein n=1 Tax=Enterobacter sp. RHBSTW-00175 TaxID=2742639 RepID=UPI0015EB02A9|nr:ead/Ea22-like family protein [Enterobacter sp. RHBSTW-00175]QMR74418.1 ead/Ea22-like family protein [Enterobacter sp. RHBSTW-00175]